MTRDETREQVRALYLRWPERRRWASARRGAYAFYRWLRASGEPVMALGSFGPGDAFLVIKAWCAEWESLWAYRLRRRRRSRSRARFGLRDKPAH